MLSDYKEQSEIERGFRFIKNDTFGLDEINLKKPERIGALMAVMTLCLLVYGLTQYRLRDALQRNNEVLPDQKRKPTCKPTLLWMLTLFSSITMINLQEAGKMKPSNMYVIYIFLHSLCAYPILNARIFQLSTGMNNHDFEVFMNNYPKTVADLLINALKKGLK